MDDEKEPYTPTAEELKGESYEYCYGQPFVIPRPPPPEEEPPA
jgi:hypothetical protein